MRPALRAAVAVAVALASALAGCAGERGPGENRLPYRPDRRDYATFQAAHPEILEPNYLPFMVHRIPGEGVDGDALVFCRWSQDDMPLSVYIEPPDIPEALQDEFSPKDPASYVAAAEAALRMWERDLEGLVRFRRVTTPGKAELALVLIAAEGPTPNLELTVLGATPVAGACTTSSRVSGALELDVTFSVPEASLYIADEFGLLSADQVQWIALHEIGHALGMRRHSPIPADLMYEVVRDRILVSSLSTQDVNSFVSLYQLENGTVFAHLPPGESSPAGLAKIPPPSGPPKLAMAPFVDSRRGFQIHPPAGWMRLETSRGMVTVDGLTWDYSASFQVIVERYPTIEAYLDRFAAYYLAKGRVLGWEFTDVGGFRALEASMVDRDELTIEQFVFIEVGDGRLIVLLMDCAAEDGPAYWPWFHATLGSLEIWREPQAGGASGSGSGRGSGGRSGGASGSGSGGEAAR